MKKFIVVIAGLIMVMSLCSVKGNSNRANAEEMVSHSKSALLMEYESGNTLYAYNSEDKLPIASMVKIMTLNLIFDSIGDKKLRYDEHITVSENAASMGGSQAFLEAGGTYKAEDLIKSIVIASANDSCVALAEHLCGSTNVFVKKMNERAKSLGMNNTNYSNCTGLPAPDAFSTAYDVALSLKSLISHDDYFKFSRIWMDNITHEGGRVTQLTNTNRLVRFFTGCDGGKTGYTNEAKHCLAATAYKNSMRLISVVIAGDSSQGRFDDVTAMFNYGFGNYENKIMLDKGTDLGEVKVNNGVNREVGIIAENNLCLFGKRGEISGEVKFDIPSSIKAPVSKGDRIGTAYVVNEKGDIVNSVFLVAENDVKKASLWDIIKRLRGE